MILYLASAGSHALWHGLCIVKGARIQPGVRMTVQATLNGSQHQGRNPDQVNILVVGSDLDEVMDVNRELRQANVDFCLHVVGDETEAMAYLLKENPYASAPKPDLVLLHAKLPVQGRIEFLNRLASHPGVFDPSAVGYLGPGLLHGEAVNGATATDGQGKETHAHAWLMQRITAGRLP